MDADDLVLLDELHHLLGRTPDRVGHLMVDEAQDLTDMELRLLARRIGQGGSTLVGDLAQATTAPRRSWDDITRQLTPTAPTVVPLRLSYRVPASVLEHANRLLPTIDAELDPGVSVRPGTHGIRFRRTEPDDLWDEVRTAVKEALDSTASVAVIAHSRRWNEGTAESEYLAGTTVERHDEDTSKGLEFDRVVLVEPADFLADELGASALYVALTRCTQGLDVVHHVPVPELSGAVDNPASPSTALRDRLLELLGRVDEELEPDDEVDELLEDGYAILAVLDDEDAARREAAIRTAGALVDLAEQLLRHA